MNACLPSTTREVLCEDWLSTLQCIQVCSIYRVRVVFSYECVDATSIVGTYVQGIEN